MNLPANQEFIATVLPLDPTWLDYDLFNNSAKTTYNLVKAFPKKFGIEFRANSAPDENSYELQDASGNIIFSRDGFKANTMHKDTVDLEVGCYTFVVYDSDKDGMSFFANNDGVGSIRFRDMGNAIVQSFNANFGTEVRFQFVVDSTLTGVSETPAEQNFNIYPNPASDKCYLENNSNEQVKTVKLFSLQGQLLRNYDGLSSEMPILIDLSGLANSYYFIEIETDNGIYREKVLVNNVR
jgi:hypothetical protein